MLDRAASAAAVAARAPVEARGRRGGYGGGGGGGDHTSAMVDDAFSGIIPGSPGGLFGGRGVASYGGGGAGLGGAIFVQQFGSLTFAGDLNISGGSAVGGVSGVPTNTATNGAGVASGLFLQGDGSLHFSRQAWAPSKRSATRLRMRQAVPGSRLRQGEWSIVKNGAGTLALGGANAYSRGTFINAGVLQGTTSSLTGKILDNAWLAFNQNFDGAIATSISGSGNFVKSGSGTVTLGSSTYAGSTTVNGGVLLLTPLTSTSNFVLDGGMLGAPAGKGEVQIRSPIAIGATPGSGLTGNITALPDLSATSSWWRALAPELASSETTVTPASRSGEAPSSCSEIPVLARRACRSRLTMASLLSREGFQRRSAETCRLQAMPTSTPAFPSLGAASFREAAGFGNPTIKPLLLQAPTLTPAVRWSQAKAVGRR